MYTWALEIHGKYDLIKAAKLLKLSCSWEFWITECCSSYETYVEKYYLNVEFGDCMAMINYVRMGLKDGGFWFKSSREVSYQVLILGSYAKVLIDAINLKCFNFTDVHSRT